MLRKQQNGPLSQRFMVDFVHFRPGRAPDPDTVRRSPFGGVWFEVRSLRFGVRKVARSPIGGFSIVLVLVVVLVLENGSGFGVRGSEFGVWSLDSEFCLLSSPF
jgi:hypothetical protein